MNRIKVPIKRNTDNPIPTYESEHASGVDLRANVSESLTIKPQSIALIPTGIHLAIPSGFEAQIRPRSGLALKKGISIVNTPGTIDSDYRGDVGVILINHSNEDFVVNKGDRIAQMIFVPVVKADFVEVDELDDTKRGSGGFGSTGKK